MREADFPALYKTADELSATSQKHFFRALRVHLVVLVLAAVASLVTISHWSVAALQLLALLLALGCSIYLFSVRPDRLWYAGRAAAESIKTITWRYICRAEPFQNDLSADSDFRNTLKAIIDQNREVFQALTDENTGAQITEAMIEGRSKPLQARRAIYAEKRISDQLRWYAKKASFNRRMSSGFFWFLIAINGAAVIAAVLRMANLGGPFWPTDVLVAAAASVLSWMQAKRFSELAASYSLASHEISLIREKSLLPDTEDAFSVFVGDAENAFSREHTQWVARKDV